MSGHSNCTAPDNPLDHVFNADDLLAMDLPAPRWIVPDLIPEGLTLIAGKSKAGKSWWVLQTGLAVAEEQGEVLYLALEDTPRRLKERILKVQDGKSVPRRLQLACQGRWPRLDMGGVDRLREWLNQHRGQARLIIVDTLAKVKPVGKRNSNAYDDDYKALAGLKQLADEFGVGIIVVHHLRKQTDADDPFNEISGTTALMGCADTSMVLRRARNSNKADLFVTGRDVEERQIPMIWNPDTCCWTAVQPTGHEDLPESRRLVISLLTRHGPMTMRRIIEIAGKPEGTVKSVLSRMLQDVQLENLQGVYHIAGDHASAATGATDETSETSATAATGGTFKTGSIDDSLLSIDSNETDAGEDVVSAV